MDDIISSFSSFTSVAGPAYRESHESMGRGVYMEVGLNAIAMGGMLILIEVEWF